MFAGEKFVKVMLPFMLIDVFVFFVVFNGTRSLRLHTPFLIPLSLPSHSPLWLETSHRPTLHDDNSAVTRNATFNVLRNATERLLDLHTK